MNHEDMTDGEFLRKYAKSLPILYPEIGKIANRFKSIANKLETLQAVVDKVNFN